MITPADREALTTARSLMSSPRRDDREAGETRRRYLVMRLGVKAVLDIENALKGRESQNRNTWKEKVSA